MIIEASYNELSFQFLPKRLGAHHNLRLIVLSITFVLRHNVVKVTSSVFQPAMSKKRTILSLNQQIGMLRRLGEEHR